MTINNHQLEITEELESQGKIIAAYNIPDLVRALRRINNFRIKERKVTVFGGSQYRPFLHVSDASDAIIFSLEKNLTGTYNVVSENLTIKQAAERISKVTGCKINVSNDNEDKRNYKVSAEKLKQIGFEPSKTIEDAINEIKETIDNGQLSNYDDAKYSNYKLLFGSKEMQEKVFIQGMPGSLDVP